jgi:hypothetical protein
MAVTEDHIGTTSMPEIGARSAAKKIRRGRSPKESAAVLNGLWITNQPIAHRHHLARHSHFGFADRWRKDNFPIGPETPRAMMPA